MIFRLSSHLMWLCSVHVFIATSVMIGLLSTPNLDTPVAESHELLDSAVKHLASCPTLVVMRRSR